jgi:drug/metabolite transporter (DMT)-like permease
VNDVVSVVTAIAAAASFAMSSVAQQRAAATAPASESLKPRLLLDLLHRPWWLPGTGLMVLAYGLQVVALGFGDVALVQPLIATELLFAIPLAVRLRKKRPGISDWVGAVLVAAGVSVFLIAARPAAGPARADAGTWLTALGPPGAVIGCLVLFARGPQTRSRAMLLGGGAGIANGWWRSSPAASRSS